ncbi:MAG: TlpA family protein disulfide reductase [Gammaproteobacteria bacterium]|nr:TlpA family protein disulfide reductase [Gammaproteobacteria bacterium]
MIKTVFQSSIYCLLLLFVSFSGAADQSLHLSLPDLNGKLQNLEQYKGKWIIVNYWATSCQPCLKEIPELASFYEQHKDKDAVVLGINYEDIPLSWLQQFMNTVPINYPVWRSLPSAKTPFGLIQVLPTTYIISPEGKLMGRQQGAVNQEMLNNYLEKKTREARIQQDALKP